MKILILSDLHLEFDRFSPVHKGERIDEGVDVVVLAGDIAEGLQGIRWARETFATKEIVYVAGNHEYYDRHFEHLQAEMRDVANRMGVYFLDQDSVGLFGVRFLGATLWTDFSVFGESKKPAAMFDAMRYMNDYKCIQTSCAPPGHEVAGSRRLHPRDTVRLHEQAVAWLGRELDQADAGKTVVVTHHAPHRHSVHGRYANDILTAAYVSDLGRLMGRSNLWIHGHMHDGCDYVVNGTRVVCNPRGYARWDVSVENARFNPGGTLEIG
jgi:Icc-related predicted phosphoesterase